MRYILGLLLFLSVTLGQVNDKNFKQNVNGGMVVVVVTAEWQEQELDEDILKGVKGYQDCKIITKSRCGRRRSKGCKEIKV